jgi:hypothetical protein
MSGGIMMIGLPDVTLGVIRALSLKTGKSMVDVLGDAIMEKAKKHLTDDELIQALKDDGSSKSS